MRHLLNRWLCVGFFAVLILLPGCRKSSPPPSPPSAEQLAREQEFQNTSGVIVCDLKKAKLGDIELPQNQPYFIYDMERNNTDTLLRGELTIEKADFIVLLPIDNAAGQMALYEKSVNRSPYWWGADDINSVHKINNKYYEFCLLENSTKFAARPYTGQTGIFKVGKGGRSVETCEFGGSVKSERYAAAVGVVDENGWTKPVGEYEIPAGDYYPALMDVKYDNLAIMISNNYHRDVNGKPMGERKPVYGFNIRPDTPYVLDFSNAPVIVFDEPAPDTNRFKRGDEIKFAAVLVDPKLDIMIRGLRDNSIEVDKEYTDAAGNKVSYKEKKSLDPNVIIARADGEIVAQGVMPFGWAGTCGYAWRIPNDLRLNGAQEQFTVTVTYDTQKLYGKVTASRNITIARD